LKSFDLQNEWFQILNMATTLICRSSPTPSPTFTSSQMAGEGKCAVGSLVTAQRNEKTHQVQQGIDASMPVGGKILPLSRLESSPRCCPATSSKFHGLMAMKPTRSLSQNWKGMGNQWFPVNFPLNQSIDGGVTGVVVCCS
jgi:hypothetical protein